MRDYYSDLGLTKGCEFDDISDAFRKLALKRSDLPTLNKIAEAYEVLSDPEKRRNYDLFGEYVFKEGLILDSKLIEGYKFKNNTSEILLKFFGTLHPYFLSKPEPDNKPKQLPPNDVIFEVPCTLEELYLGCRKNIRYSGSNEDGMWKMLEIPPGCDASHDFIFYGEGEESEYYPRSNLVFRIKELPNKCFQREGKDLVYTARITLLHALSGLPIEIETLDKKKILVGFDQVISHGTIKVLPKLGFLPKGNLVVKVEVIFPKYLSIDSKERLASILT